MHYTEIINKLKAFGLPVLPVAPRQDPRENEKAVLKIDKGQYKTESWQGKKHKEICKSLKIEPSIVSSLDSGGACYELFPQCYLDEQLDPVVRFTGKNPSYLDKEGCPRTINHADYQKRLPSETEYKVWFANPKNGIGCLGNKRYRWLDPDRKHFTSQEECDRAMNEICSPELQSKGWFEQTHSGGYRLLVDCGDQGADFTNFALTEGGDHVGELLGAGRFAVLAPTIGVSGNPYRNINYGEPIPIEQLKLFSTVKKKAAAVIKPSMPRSSSSKAIELFSCLSQAAQAIITGNPESDDRSRDLTKAAKDSFGWENWLNANQISFNGSAESLIDDCGEALGIDSDRVLRIKKSIDPTSCSPACVLRGGDAAAQQKVKKLQYALNPISRNDLRYVSKLEDPCDIDLLSLLPKKYIEAVKYGIDKPLSHIATVKSLAVATEAYLISKEIAFTGSAKDIFSQFCQNQEPPLNADFEGIPCDDSGKVDIPTIKKLLDSHESEQAKLLERIERERAREEREMQKAELDDDEEICYLAQSIAAIKNKYGDRFRLNELTGEIELDGVVMDLDRVRIKFADELNIQISKADAVDIIAEIAESNKYHPVHDYLDDCNKKYGDDTSILNGLAAQCLGTANPLYEVFLQKTLIAAVARIHEPSCKVDHVLCLVGAQGYQKSSFFETLAGAEYFTDNLDKELTNKDNLMRVHRKWFCEIGEIDRVSNSRYEGDLKNFITIKTDLMRLPYARSPKEFKRRFLFVGTSNRSDFLTDPTGDRRYWLIQVAKKIDIDFIKENRDRIWAAAVSLYKSGVKWWLSDIEKAASDRNNERYRSDSPWMPLIAEFCKAREKVSNTEILYHVEGDASRHTSAMQRDIVNCLMRLGFTRSGGKHRINIHEKQMTVNSWVAPKDFDIGGSLGGSSSNPDLISDPEDMANLGGSLGGSSSNAYTASNSEEMIHLIHQKQVKLCNETNICLLPLTSGDARIFSQEKKFETIQVDQVDHTRSNVSTATTNDDPPNDFVGSGGSLLVSNDPTAEEIAPTVETDRYLRAYQRGWDGSLFTLMQYDY